MSSSEALADVARADGVEQPVAPGSVGSGHLQVEAALGGADDGRGGHPVAHHDAVEAPLVLEHPGEQRAVLGSGRGGGAVVDPGVRAHDRPRLGLVHELLERRQVHLAQRLLVDARQVGGALRLGVVGDEVLDAHPDAAVLRGAHHVHRDGAGEQRVLGVALEVPAADRACAAGSPAGRARRRPRAGGPRRRTRDRARRRGPRPTSRRARWGRGTTRRSRRRSRRRRGRRRGRRRRAWRAGRCAGSRWWTTGRHRRPGAPSPRG